MGIVKLCSTDRDRLVEDIAEAVGNLADVYGVILPAGLRGLIGEDVADNIFKPFLEEITDENHVLRRDLRSADRTHRMPPVRPE